MKESSPLLEALDACETKDIERCHVSLPVRQRSAAVSVDRAVLNSVARMTAASCDTPTDCDVEIICEKIVPSAIVEKNGAKTDEVVPQDKLTSRFTADKNKKLPGQRVVQVPNECGIGSYTIVYTESPAVKQCLTNKIAVGTVGERIKADGKDKVVFNGSEWRLLGSDNNKTCSDQGSASENRPGVSASSAHRGTLILRSSDGVADGKNSPPSELLGHRLWRHADTVSINAASLKRPSLITLRPSIHSTTGTGIARTPGELERTRLSCKSPAVTNKASPPGATFTGSGCRSGASAEGFYGLNKISDCFVRIPSMTGCGSQNGSPGRVSQVSVTVRAVRSATPRVASAVVASASVAKRISAAAAAANRSGVEVVGHPGASPSAAATAQPSKPFAGLAKRGRGRPRRQLLPTETVVLSSDEESDEVKEANSPSKRRRLSAEGDAVSLSADDDLFPDIASPNASRAPCQMYSRRLVMQSPQQARPKPVDLRGERKREQMERRSDAVQSSPATDGFMLHAIEVHIGTKLCKPVDDLVHFSIDQGIKMSLYADGDDCMNIRIDGRDVVGCVAHFSKSLAAVFLSCTSALGIKLRQIFCMTDVSQQYYDPHGIVEAQKYIVVIFDSGRIAEPTNQQRCVVNYFQEMGKKYKSGGQFLCKLIQLAEANERLTQLRLIAAPASSSPRACGGSPELSAHCSRNSSGQMPTSSVRLDKRLANGERDQRQRSLISIGRRRCARLTTSALPSIRRRAIGASSNDAPSISNGDGPVHSVADADQSSGELQPKRSSTANAAASAGRRLGAALPVDEGDEDESDRSSNRSPCGDSLELPGDRTSTVSYESQATEMAEGRRTSCQETLGPSMSAAGSDEMSSPMQRHSSVSSDSQSSEESSQLALSPSVRRSLRSRDGSQSTMTADGGNQAKRLLFYPYPRVMGSIAVTTGDVACLEEEEFLNDVIVDFYLKYLFEERLSPNIRRRTHVFSSFFYMRLMQSGYTRRPGEPQSSVKDRRHNGVKTWTRHVDVFEKDYLIVPINEHSHWYLAVICFPSAIPAMFESLSKLPHTVNLSQEEPPNAEGSGTSAELVGLPERMDDSESKSTDVAIDDSSTICSGEASPKVPLDRLPPRPFIVIFDSLGGCSRRSTSIRVLREYLEVEWRTRKGPANLTGPLRDLFTKDSIPGWCPACPGQDNSCDCGIYLLQYVESFFEEPVMDQSPETTERLRNWFPQERIRRKRQDIKDLLNSMHTSFMQPKQQSADG